MTSHLTSHMTPFFPANYLGEEISHYNPLRGNFEIVHDTHCHVNIALETLPWQCHHGNRINPTQEPYNDAEKKLMTATVDVFNNEEGRRGEEEEEMVH